MTPTEVLPGAEAWAAEGGPNGALVLHGFTGNPTSMRSLAEAFAAAGFAVELPRLPGHGTTVEDMATTSWADWSAEAEAAYQRLAARTERVVVAGLSMGGTLAVWLAARHPEIAAVVAVNAAVEPMPGMRAAVDALTAEGATFLPGVGSDIAAPGVVESAYTQVPVAGLGALLDAIDDLQPKLADIRCPVLVAGSPQDHVVPPSASDHLAASVGGPVTRLVLERSYHVATLDLDREDLEAAAVGFASEALAQAQPSM